jgi:hypothetical protein
MVDRLYYLTEKAKLGATSKDEIRELVNLVNDGIIGRKMTTDDDINVVVAMSLAHQASDLIIDILTGKARRDGTLSSIDGIINEETPECLIVFKEQLIERINKMELKISKAKEDGLITEVQVVDVRKGRIKKGVVKSGVVKRGVVKHRG